MRRDSKTWNGCQTVRSGVGYTTAPKGGSIGVDIPYICDLSAPDGVNVKSHSYKNKNEPNH